MFMLLITAIAHLVRFYLFGKTGKVTFGRVFPVWPGQTLLPQMIPFGKEMWRKKNLPNGLTANVPVWQGNVA